MATMQFTCPHCSGVFQVDSSMAGAQVACPQCQGVVAVPAMGGAAPAQSTHQPSGGVQQQAPGTAAAPGAQHGRGAPHFAVTRSRSRTTSEARKCAGANHAWRSTADIGW